MKINLQCLISNYFRIIFRLAKEHNTDYSIVAVSNQIAGVLASFIPALLLVDAEQGSGGEINNEGDTVLVGYYDYETRPKNSHRPIIVTGR